MPTAAQIKQQLLANWIRFLNTNSAKLSMESLSGATPPAVFLLVPTKWSISATDDVISHRLIKDIKIFPTIETFTVYKFDHLGCVILIPDDVWSFEMQEAWYDKSGQVGIGRDFEGANGLDHYPTIAGAYFAGSLAVTEYLSNIKHKASAMSLREIRSEYVPQLEYL